MHGNYTFLSWLVTMTWFLETALISASQQPETIPRACTPPHDVYPYCNASLPLDQRLEDLISRLTLEEKPYLLVARASPKGNISRLGIPEYDWGGNCMHGVQSRCAPDGRCPTSFPNPNNLGASFNETLWKAMGAVIGLELRALWLQNVGEKTTSSLPFPHIGLDCWSPNIDIQRDPRWGRNMETPSEDPFVCGRYGVAYTVGLQNNSLDDRYLQAVATLKHFDANSLEGNWTADGTWKKNGSISRHSVNSNISLYDLYSTYLPSFRDAVVEGGAAGIMCSFNRINGVPSCANTWLLKTVLRDEWKFRGYVTSDTGAIFDILKYHNYTKNWTETVSAAISAGCDVESALWPHPWGTSGQYIDNLPNAVAEGLIDEGVIDQALRNALGVRFRLGLFDPISEQPFWQVNPDVVQKFEHVELAKESTAQGFVLLKNENQMLPLDPRKSYAVVGPHANDRTAMLGNYFGEICFNDNSNACVTSFYEAIETTVSMYGGSAINATGCSVNGTSESGFQTALDAAKSCDFVIFIGGTDLQIENEAKDRNDVRLPQIQVHLIQELLAVNDDILVVLLHGGMLAVENIFSVKSLISAGYPGMYGAGALSNAIFGFTSKAWGKLPVTWYKSSIVNELNMLDFEMSKAPGRTYRYYTGEPAFQFGYGLNPLTNFVIELVAPSNHKPRITKTNNGSTIVISVSNVGPRHGDEVILAFFRPRTGVIPSSEPASKLRKQLFGFQRISLPVDSTTILSFEVSAQTLRLYDSKGNPTLFPGIYEIEISNGNDASVTVEVTVEILDTSYKSTV